MNKQDYLTVQEALKERYKPGHALNPIQLSMDDPENALIEMVVKPDSDFASDTARDAAIGKRVRESTLELLDFELWRIEAHAKELGPWPFEDEEKFQDDVKARTKDIQLAASGK